MKNHVTLLAAAVVAVMTIISASPIDVPSHLKTDVRHTPLTIGTHAVITTLASSMHTKPYPAIQPSPQLWSEIPVLFSQPPDFFGDYYASQYESAAQDNILCQDDFYGLDHVISGIQFWGVDLIYNGAYHPGDPTGQTFQITFYTNDNGTPGDSVAVFSGLQTTAVVYDAWGDYGNEYLWSFHLPSPVALDSGWVSVQSTGAPDGSVFYWTTSAKTCPWNALQNGQCIFQSLAFNLTNPGTNVDHDVALLRVTSPFDEPAGILAPKALLANKANTSQTFQVNLKITRSALEYNQTISVTFGPRIIREVTFPAWTPAAWQQVENTTVEYTAVATALLTDDQNPLDNSKTTQFSLTYPYLHDLLVSQISPASDDLGQTLPVAIQLLNTGQFPERNFSVSSRIGIFQDLFYEPFSGTQLPNGWGTDTSHWHIRGSSNAGGVAPEAALSWNPPANGTFRLWTCPINTSGKTTLDLVFKHTVWEFPSGNFTLSVQTTGDGLTWHIIWSIPAGYYSKERVTIALNQTDGVGSATFQVAWVFNGSLAYYDYWFLDNIRLHDPTSLVEYNASIEVPDWLDPGQSVNLTFPNWTPTYLQEYHPSAIFEYDVHCAHHLITDTHPSNDALTTCFELTYSHDTLIKAITSPSAASENEPSDEVYLHFDDGTNQNSIGLTSGGTFESAIRLTPAELSPYAGNLLNQVRIHYGYPDGNPAPALHGRVKIYDDGTDTSPGSLLSTENFTSPTTFSWFNVSLSYPVSIAEDKDIWVSVEWTHSTGQYPAGVDNGPYAPGKSDWVYVNGNWIELGIYGYDINWNLGAYVGYPPPPPRPYYVGRNQTFRCILTNTGTYTECNLTCAATVIRISDWSVYYQGFIQNISLPPLGAEQNLTFEPCPFLSHDYFWLYVNLTPDTDDKPSNNHRKMYLISDPYPPVSTLNVSSPDGNDGWYRCPAIVYISAGDNISYLSYQCYQIDDAESVKVYAYDYLFQVNQSGNHTIRTWAVDGAGNNNTPLVATAKIDRDPPHLQFNKTIGFNKIVYTANVTDNISGMAFVQFWIGTSLQKTVQAPGPYTWILSPIPDMNVTVTAVAYDQAGNSVSAYQGSLTDLSLTCLSHQATRQSYNIERR